MMTSIDPPGGEMKNIFSRHAIEDLRENECCTLYSDEIFVKHKKLEFPLCESTQRPKNDQESFSSPMQLLDVPNRPVFGFGCIPKFDEYKVIFESIEGNLYRYDPWNQQFQYVHIQGNPDNLELFVYKESLVLPDLGTSSWPIKIHNDGIEELER
ncbi:hypothetical protein CQW23_23585 [Capsicum baccatum]|uniref:Uncharacterized protein n=1 Tax=Capsicum baccatum TaxID=33114 RepID=A0A2G2VSE2_CAPBA|nr:hypothetical protein CQW23_23585 [Capsicum baccatum]